MKNWFFFFQTRESVFQKMDLFFLRNLFSEKKGNSNFIQLFLFFSNTFLKNFF